MSEMTREEFVAQFKKVELVPPEQESPLEQWQKVLDGVYDHEEEWQKTGGQLGIMSNLAELDRLTLGWQNGQMIVVGARPGMGKSAFGLGMAIEAARQGKRTIFFSLEMSKLELGQRSFGWDSRVEIDHLRRHTLDEVDLMKMADTYEHAPEFPLWIVDDSSVGPQEILDIVQGVAPDTEFIVVDYLQLMRSNKGEGRQFEVQEMSQNMKRIAHGLGIPVMVLAQLSRNLESRADKRPVLSDLRDSGSIEQDADVVLFLYRDDYYYPEGDGGVAEIIVAKNRMGQSGVTAKVAWLAQNNVFADLLAIQR